MKRRAFLAGAVVGMATVMTSSGLQQPNVNPRPRDVLLTGPDIDSTGSRDCATAIQARIESSPSGTTFVLPPGTYLVAATLRLFSGHTLTGPGAIIRAAPTLAEVALIATMEAGGSVADDGTVTTAAQDVNIKNLTIDGNATARGLPANSHAHTIALAYASGARVSNCWIHDSTDSAIALYNCVDTTVERNLIERTGGSGILTMQATRGTRIIDNTIDGTSRQNGIFVMAQGGLASSNTTIRHNTVRNIADFGIEVGDIVNDAQQEHAHVIIANNSITNAMNDGIGLRTVKDCTVVNNRVVDCGNMSTYFGAGGILVLGDNQPCRNITVKRNFVHTTKAPTGTADGIFATGVHSLSITDNEVRGVAGSGINVNSSSMSKPTTAYSDRQRTVEEVEITRNVVSATGESGIAIQFAFDSHNVSVRENNISNAGTSGVSATSAGGSSRGIAISKNAIDRTNNQGVVVYGWGDVVVSDNSVRGFGTRYANDDERCAVLLVAVAEGIAVRNDVTPGIAGGWRYGIHHSTGIRIDEGRPDLPDRAFDNSDVRQAD